MGKMDFLVPKGAKKEEFKDVNILTWSIMSNYQMLSSLFLGVGERDSHE